MKIYGIDKCKSFEEITPEKIGAVSDGNLTALRGDSDWDKFTQTGIYAVNTWAGSGGVNTPPRQLTGICVVHNNGNVITQIAVNGNNLFARSYSDGAWSNWTENFYTAQTKPSGSYAGNGSATQRKIDVGDSKEANPLLYIYSPQSGGSALVCRTHILCWNGAASFTLENSKGYCYNGTFHLTTDHSYLNANGYTYYWRVL